MRAMRHLRLMKKIGRSLEKTGKSWAQEDTRAGGRTLGGGDESQIQYPAFWPSLIHSFYPVFQLNPSEPPKQNRRIIVSVPKPLIIEAHYEIQSMTDSLSEPDMTLDSAAEYNNAMR